MKFTFLHKPRPIGYQTLKVGKWTNLAFRDLRRRFYSDASGQLTAELYTRIEFDLSSTLPAIVRVRLVRDKYQGKGIDPTGYDERTLTLGGNGVATIHWHYTGQAEKGRRYYWQITVLGDVAKARVTTRYAQFWRR